jgi:hypothetical protein
MAAPDHQGEKRQDGVEGSGSTAPGILAISLSPEVGLTNPTAIVEASDGGLIGWIQVAGSFALYFNHL